MAKQGQHKGDSNDENVSRVPNKHDKSVTITKRSYKKHETHEAQARAHEATSPQPQAAKNEWNPDTRDAPTTGSPRAT